MTLYAEIVISLPLEKAFVYQIPEAYVKKIDVGSRVLVPFNRRLLTGFVIKLHKKNPVKGIESKEIHRLLDEDPVFSSSFLDFTHELAKYFFSPWGEMLQASLPPSLTLKSRRRILLTERGLRALQESALTRDEKKLMQFLQKGSYSEFYLKRKLQLKNFNSMVLRLEKKEWLHRQEDLRERKRRENKAAPSPLTQLEIDFSLDKESHVLAGRIADCLERDTFRPFLLHAPAEKREAVFLYLIKKCLYLRKRILFLVPEIALTSGMVDKFEKKLGKKATLLHSRLSPKEREKAWMRIKAGEIDVVIGPRSALLSPLDNLGLIIVDEEQDDSYFQKETPTYDARKGAWVRAEKAAAALIYGSAYPSMEAMYRAKSQGYLYQVEGQPPLRGIKIIDDQKEKGLISRKIISSIQTRLDHQEPVLVFCSRRGYAAYLSCSRCHWVPRCRQCDIALTFHKREEKLVCHYCRYTIAYKNVCPECGSKVIQLKGVGIEVIHEELQRIFPGCRMGVFAPDETGSKKKQEKILSDYLKGKIDILLGTPILAHRFELIPASLAVIFYPENILSLSDYRASQKTYQSINQIIKFLGRDRKADLFLQTTLPQHYSISCAASGDYLAFYNEEIKYRRVMQYPPFSYMAEVVFQGENLRTLAAKSRKFHSLLRSRAKDMEILGPAKAPISRIRGTNRIQIIIKSTEKSALNQALTGALAQIHAKKSVYLYE